MAANPPVPDRDVPDRDVSEHDVDDTIIGGSRTGPRLRNSASLNPADSVADNLTHADAPTILVSRAHSGAVDAALAEYAHRRTPRQPTTPQQLTTFSIVIGAHAPIPLDVPAYIGRRPRAPRIEGLQIPRLIVVPSPQQEISNTHLEIVQHGDAVVVTDLGSTNGTTVTVSGLLPRSLRQGESLVVGEGAVVDIGEGIRIVIKTFSDDETREGAP